jgi:hypothetical protein
MLLLIRQFWTRLAGAAIALAVVACSTSSAKAECGDYVRIGSESMQHPMQPAQPGPAAPCDGPSCRNRQDAPLIPPAPAPVLIDDLFCLITMPSAPSLPRGGRVVLDDLNYSTIFPNDIFHPPK